MNNESPDDKPGPWDVSDSNSSGSKGEGSNDPKPGKNDRPSNPWEPSAVDDQKGPKRGPSLEELFRRAGNGKGGGFGGLPSRPNGKSWWPIILGTIALIWFGLTSIHRLGLGEQGVVTTLGKYSHTANSGIAFTLPAPIQKMEKVDTQQIRTTSVGSAKADSDNLILTQDGNLVDMAYNIGWSIKSPEMFLFQLEDPDRSVREVAESAMRAAVANFNLDQTLGQGRGDIQEQVRRRMQQTLDQYKSGVFIQRVSILQADPPAEVTDAFREVTAAQQRRESYLNQARAYASQVTQRAQGETAEFDKIYEQYKTAPEVTRRRLYYETMEQVLNQVDKTIVETGNVTPYLPLPELQRSQPKKTQEEPVTVSGKK